MRGLEVEEVVESDRGGTIVIRKGERLQRAIYAISCQVFVLTNVDSGIPLCKGLK